MYLNDLDNLFYQVFSKNNELTVDLSLYVRYRDCTVIVTWPSANSYSQVTTRAMNGNSKRSKTTW
jgi:hypothetical protein